MTRKQPGYLCRKFNRHDMKKFATKGITVRLMMALMLISGAISAQNRGEMQAAEKDTLNEKISIFGDRLGGVEERLATAEGDLSKLTKIKLSGYIQGQFLHYEASNVWPDKVFQLRCVRIKFQYEPVTGVAFVLQPDFVPGNITLKDAYVQLNEPWLKSFSLWAGKFNRPNYEVEYSSSSREIPERSRMIRAIYPDERATGAKLEYAPQSLPLKVQLALFNGNDGLTIADASGVNINTTNSDIDNHKDLMGRLTYTFRLGSLGALGIGAHGYYGKVKANTVDLLKSDYSYNKTLDNTGKLIRKNWAGAEVQLYLDLLGGLALKGEYIFGVNGTPGYTSKTSTTGPQVYSMKNDTIFLTTTTTTTFKNRPAIERNFSGYYVYLIKNIGKRHQVAVRYDFYNPNTKLGNDLIGVNKKDLSVATVTADKITYATVGDQVIATNAQTKTTTDNVLKSGTADIKYQTITLAYSYYFNDNIKIMLGYEIPMNQKTGVNDKGVPNLTPVSYTANGVGGTYDYSDRIKQNTLTLRLQAKF